jgi:hypothetical protein
VPGLGDQLDTGTASAAARSNEPPIKPAPRTQRAGGSGVVDVVTSLIILGASQRRAAGSVRSAHAPTPAAVMDASLNRLPGRFRPCSRTLRVAAMNV